MAIFSGKTALVTGASGGLGREICLQLASNGCNIHALGRSKEKISDLVSSLATKNIEVFSTVIDFTEDFEEKVNQISRKRTYDILINCAGVFPIVNIENSTIEDYNDCFNVNVKAPFLFSKLLSKSMKKNKWGRIVNVASSSAYNGSKDTGLYCSSKHALLGLSRSLYQELKDHNVRVYTVSPGSIQTEMGAIDTRQDFSTFLKASEVAEYVLYVMSQDKELICEEIRLNRAVIR